MSESGCRGSRLTLRLPRWTPEIQRMEQVISQIKERFQLLTRLRVAVKDSPGETEPLPLYLGILLAAMDSATRAPACFILPRREKTAHLSAIVFGLTKFVADYN